MTTNKNWKLSVYIGRFQPLHNGHVSIISRAQEISENTLVLVGSSGSAPNFNNPWSDKEREDMILNSFFNNKHIRVEFLKDHIYNLPAWIQEVADHIDYYKKDMGINDNEVCFVGYEKDHTSSYLKQLPYEFVPLPAYPVTGETIDATKIRQLMWTDNIPFIRAVVPDDVYNMIKEYRVTDSFSDLRKEYEFIQDYQKKFSHIPYPESHSFTTTDAVVIQSGHILLVERGNYPGKGLMALPGGFLDNNQRLVDSMIRELREETHLKVVEKVLRGSIIGEDVFDDPKRSTRGRTITHAFLLKLDDNEKLPRIKGSDDAAKAIWVPITKLENMRGVFYEDHLHIIQAMMNRYLEDSYQYC